MSNRANKQNRGRFGGAKKPFNTDGNQASSYILENFKQYAKELDDKHDRYERIVKISRDITIESKRIIFLLHSIDSKKENSEKILCEAKQRLHNLFLNQFLLIAKELYKMDAYQYGKAYSAGLQEFIEAYTFYEFLSNSILSSWDIIQNHLKFETILEENKNPISELESNINDDDKPENVKTGNQALVVCLLQPTEYILGLADVTGELMRRCIISLGAGDIDVCFDSCRALQNFYTGYASLDTFRHRDLSRKIYTLRQSVLKAEQVCYNIKVRGSEATLLGATGEAAYLSFVGEENEKTDEGFYD